MGLRGDLGMRVLFFGTSTFSIQILEALFGSSLVDVVAVVSKADAPQGRGRALSPHPVKEYLVAHHPDCPLLCFDRSDAFVDLLRSYKADLFVVAAFGHIIKQALLDIPPLGCINTHNSLLPLYRGAAPMQRALMDGCTQTGITLIWMNAQMDAGDILAQKALAVPIQMPCGELAHRLGELGARALLEAIQALARNEPLPRQVQDESQVSFAPKIEEKDLLIDWRRPAVMIHNQIRALSPTPGAWSPLRIQDRTVRCKIYSSSLPHEAMTSLHDLPVGSLLPYSASEASLWVACGEGSILQLLSLQLPGKPLCTATAFLNGYRQHPLRFVGSGDP